MTMEEEDHAGKFFTPCDFQGIQDKVFGCVSLDRKPCSPSVELHAEANSQAQIISTDDVMSQSFKRILRIV